MNPEKGWVMNIFEYLEECFSSDSEAALLLREKSDLAPTLVEGRVEKIDPETRLVRVNGQTIEPGEVIGYPEPGF